MTFIVQVFISLSAKVGLVGKLGFDRFTAHFSLLSLSGSRIASVELALFHHI